MSVAQTIGCPSSVPSAQAVKATRVGASRPGDAYTPVTRSIATSPGATVTGQSRCPSPSTPPSSGRISGIHGGTVTRMVTVSGSAPELFSPIV